MEFETPEGGAALALRSFAGQPLLINFWATWCPPCVDELPMLDAFYRAHATQGWQLLGLAVDQRTAVRQFLERIPLAFPIGLAASDGIALGRSLGNLTGSLPFTLLLGAQGQTLDRKMGRLTEQDLELWSALR